MNVEQARFNMIEQQIRPWHLLDERVVDALYLVRREDFVPVQHRMLSFADLSVPIGFGQAMLPPRLEARILQETRLQESDRVLEVGTGSGYLSALLSVSAQQVSSVERVPELALLAQKRLDEHGFANVSVIAGDGLGGWQENSPYDVIVVSGLLGQIPEKLLAQLRPGGRLIAFVGVAPLARAQRVVCTEPGVFVTQDLFETAIPALLGTACDRASGNEPAILGVS